MNFLSSISPRRCTMFVLVSSWFVLLKTLPAQELKAQTHDRTAVGALEELMELQTRQGDLSGAAKTAERIRKIDPDNPVLRRTENRSMKERPSADQPDKPGKPDTSDTNDKPDRSGIPWDQKNKSRSAKETEVDTPDTEVERPVWIEQMMERIHGKEPVPKAEAAEMTKRLQAEASAHPSDLELQFWLAETREAAGQNEEASELVRKIQSNPSLSDELRRDVATFARSLRVNQLVKQAEIALDHNRLEESLTLTQQALALLPDDPDAHLAKARTQTAQGHGEAAIETLGPNPPEGKEQERSWHLIRAHAGAQLGRWNDSFDDCRQALADPDISLSDRWDAIELVDKLAAQSKGILGTSFEFIDSSEGHWSTTHSIFQIAPIRGSASLFRGDVIWDYLQPAADAKDHFRNLVEARLGWVQPLGTRWDVEGYIWLGGPKGPGGEIAAVRPEIEDWGLNVRALLRAPARDSQLLRSFDGRQDGIVLEIIKASPGDRFHFETKAAGRIVRIGSEEVARGFEDQTQALWRIIGGGEKTINVSAGVVAEWSHYRERHVRGLPDPRALVEPRIGRNDFEVNISRPLGQRWFAEVTAAAGWEAVAKSFAWRSGAMLSFRPTPANKLSVGVDHDSVGTRVGSREPYTALRATWSWQF